MKKLVQFLLFAVIMIVATSCTTTSYVESSDDPLYNEGRSYYGLYNPYGYDLLYSTSWGYYYYNPYNKMRFLFDDYIYYYYPHLRNGYRGNHWDYNQYNQNRSSGRVNPSRNYVQKNVKRNNYRQSPATRQNVQRSNPSSRQQNIQRSTPARSNYQRSPATNRGNSTGRRR